MTAQNLREDEKNWDNQLGRIQWGLNNTVQKTIGRTTAEVMFGTEMMSEFNPALNEIIEETREVSSLPSIRSEVKCNIDKAQEAQRERGARNAITTKEGDPHVLIITVI